MGSLSDHAVISTPLCQHLHHPSMVLLLYLSPQPVEGATDFLQLLKSHKEKLDEGMRELRRRNEELERERDEVEKERERMRRTIDQLRAKLAQAQVTFLNTHCNQWEFPFLIFEVCTQPLCPSLTSSVSLQISDSTCQI